METIKKQHDRRTFLKLSALSGGGLMLGFNWGCGSTPELAAEEVVKELPKAWYDINAYLKIGDNGLVTIMSPNPEIGQNVKTSMPMVVAEELDVDWDDVIVEQGELKPDSYQHQGAGGSNSIHLGWDGLRRAGATARQLLINAAAKRWNTSPRQITTENGVCHFQEQKLSYGELASEAALLEIPEEVPFKKARDYKIIGTEKGNVELENILKGAPIYGLDFYREGMLYAVVERPPFGAKLVSFDDTEARKIQGVVDVFSFGDKVTVVAQSTWQAIKARKALTINWNNGGRYESTRVHERALDAEIGKEGQMKRHDGNIQRVFAEADEIVEADYFYPYMPHNSMEPMNCFAHITENSAEIVAPTQNPRRVRTEIAELLGRGPEEVFVTMTRMGGGFGRKSYRDYPLEVAEISNRLKQPVQLVYTREDDVKAGRYRPIIKFRYRASIKDGKMTGLRYKSTSPYYRMYGTRERKFPAGALENFYAEAQGSRNSISGGIWRAPFINSMAVAEQSFLDEVAERTGEDPIQMRRELLYKAKANPIGEMDYGPDRMLSVLDLVEEKSAWKNAASGVFQGVSLFYGHRSYVAVVAEAVVTNREPKISKVVMAIDCGIVVNPLAARNQVEGAIVDAIGHAMYAELTFDQGKAQETNFDKYRMIRISEAPEIEVHFVESEEHPTGLGEPPFPPVGAAVANAFAKATGKRVRRVPFIKDPNFTV